MSLRETVDDAQERIAGIQRQVESLSTPGDGDLAALSDAVDSLKWVLSEVSDQVNDEGGSK